MPDGGRPGVVAELRGRSDMAPRYFGTDGVRGIPGESLDGELVFRLGRAATLWAGGGRVVVGHDTRASSPALVEELARGIVAAGGTAVLGGVLPTPAVALSTDRLGAVVTASHNPPEYNGVKLFGAHGSKLAIAAEEEIEALLDTPGPGGGSVEHAASAAEAYVEHVASRFGTSLDGLRIAVDCANGAYSGIAPALLERLGAEVTAVACRPDGTNINRDCGATDLALLADTVRAESLDLGVAFDGDGDRMLAVDDRGDPVDGDQIVAVLALALGVDAVAVTSMTNLGFHRLMAEHSIRVAVTDVGDRHVLEALRREGALLGGEQSGHVIYLDGHVAGDGLVAALLLCRCLNGRSLREAASVLRRLPQAQENVRVPCRAVPAAVAAEATLLNAELAGRGRVLVRASGTESLLRVLAEAESEEEAAALCGRIVHLIRRELGIA